MTSMLSAVLKFRAVDQSILPRTHGKKIHGAFLSMVREHDARLGWRLHKGNESRLFTLSQIFGEREILATSILVKKDAQCFVRVTSLDGELRGYLENLKSSAGLLWTLCESNFVLEEVITDEERHELAGESSFESLSALWGGPNVSSPSSIRFDFTSPTCFRSGDVNLLFPTPAILFETLADRWKQAAPEPFASQIASEISDLLKTNVSDHRAKPRQIDEIVFVEQYRLATNMLDFGEFRRIGFSGDLTLSFAPGVPQPWKNLVALLSEFAVFAGVGYQTTMGMGQVEVTVR